MGSAPLVRIYARLLRKRLNECEILESKRCFKTQTALQDLLMRTCSCLKIGSVDEHRLKLKEQVACIFLSTAV